MITISQLLSRQLVDRDNARCYGTVHNVGIVDSRIILCTDQCCVTVGKIYNIDGIITACQCANTTQPTLLLDRSVYTNRGMSLGKVTDIELTSTMTAKKIITPLVQLTMSKIIAIEDVLLTKPISLPTVQPTIIQYGNCDWVIGRICYKNITNYNNEIIVRSGQIIDRKTLLVCKSVCKLRELIANSR